MNAKKGRKMHLKKYYRNHVLTINHLRIALLVASAIILGTFKLFSHVADVHIPTSEDCALEHKIEENTKEKDSLIVDYSEDEEIEFRSDGTTNIYDKKSGKCKGKVS